MLPNLHYQRYQEFLKALEQLQQTAAATQPDVPSLRQRVLEVQQFFQQQIVSLDAGDLEPDSEARVRSYQTEISKQLRLLEVDVIFLQAARQAETAKGRQRQAVERIQTLQRYCNEILQLN
jgi:hypothetical protein